MQLKDRSPPAIQASEEARLVGVHRTLALAGLAERKRSDYREVEVRGDLGGHPEHEVEPRGWVP